VEKQSTVTVVPSLVEEGQQRVLPLAEAGEVICRENVWTQERRRKGPLEKAAL